MIRKFNKPEFSQKPFIKYIPPACALVAVLLFPAEVFHFLAVLAHTVYESIAFAVEEFLTHVFHFSKFQAQMLVFYSSCAIAGGILYRCLRRVPIWLKRTNRRCRQFCMELQAQWQTYWQMLPVLKKLQVLLVHFAFLAGSLSYMLA